jgi:hypothetical protein
VRGASSVERRGSSVKGRAVRVESETTPVRDFRELRVCRMAFGLCTRSLVSNRHARESGHPGGAEKWIPASETVDKRGRAGCAGRATLQNWPAEPALRSGTDLARSIGSGKSTLSSAGMTNRMDPEAFGKSLAFEAAMQIYLISKPGQAIATITFAPSWSP